MVLRSKSFDIFSNAILNAMILPTSTTLSDGSTVRVTIVELGLGLNEGAGFGGIGVGVRVGGYGVGVSVGAGVGVGVLTGSVRNKNVDP